MRTKETLSYPYVENRSRKHPAFAARFGRPRNTARGGGTTVAVPDTPEAMAEFLADDKKTAAVFKDAEGRKKFFAEYNRKLNKGETLSKQISEQVQAGIVDFLKNNGVEGRPDQTEVDAILSKIHPGTGAQRNAVHNPAAPGAKLDGVVNDLGDFAQLINHKKPPRTDEAKSKLEQIHQVSNAYSSVDPASAGFLIPEEMRSDLLQLTLEATIVRSRATVITMQSLTQSIPFVDSSTHVGSVFGGMIFYWTAESGEILRSEAKFGRVKLEANKLTGGARVPNELWADAPALSSWLMSATPQGLAFFEDLAFLLGSGVGEPLGIYESAAKVVVAKETSQEADTIVPENLYKMYSRMLPQSLNSAVWVANQTTLPQLLGLSHVVKNVAGTENVGGNAIGLVQSGSIAGAPTLSILGRPLVITEKNPVVGDEGDVAFVDFGQYLIGDRQAVSMESSEHSRFMHDETELRIIERVDGRPWVQSALQPYKGDTVSPVVVLAARA